MIEFERTRVEWYPPSGEPPTVFTTGDAAKLRLLQLTGVSENLAEPLGIKSPGQAGQTVVDAVVGSRFPGLRALAQTRSRDELWALRRQLARAFVRPPARLGGAIAHGRLRVVRGGDQPALELEAIPQNSPQVEPIRGKGLALVDATWLCPYPYWMQVADSFRALESAGGFTWPLTFPLAMETNNIEVEIDNAGDVDAPILARLYGDVTTARIRNITTGEALEITGQILAGEHVEIQTAFGQKKAELVAANGTRTSVMSRVNLALADFWQLRPGVNLVRFEADINVSGRATVHWRERFAGL